MTNLLRMFRKIRRSLDLGWNPKEDQHW